MNIKEKFSDTLATLIQRNYNDFERMGFADPYDLATRIACDVAEQYAEYVLDEVKALNESTEQEQIDSVIGDKTVYRYIFNPTEAVTAAYIFKKL